MIRFYNSKRWVPLARMEEGKNSTNNIFNKIMSFVRPLKLWIRDYMSGKSKERSSIISESETEPNQAAPIKQEVVIKTVHTEPIEHVSVFDAKLAELGREFERKLEELDKIEEEEQKPEPNPFLTFKLDHASLKAAFDFSN